VLFIIIQSHDACPITIQSGSSNTLEPALAVKNKVQQYGHAK
jgi:hypothetical protein